MILNEVINNVGHTLLIWLITRLIQTDLGCCFFLVVTVEPRVVHMGDGGSAYCSFHLLVFAFIFSNPQLCGQFFLISECLFQTAQHPWPLFLPTSQSWKSHCITKDCCRIFEKALSRNISVLCFLNRTPKKYPRFLVNSFAVLYEGKKWHECSLLHSGQHSHWALVKGGVPCLLPPSTPAPCVCCCAVSSALFYPLTGFVWREGFLAGAGLLL